MRLQRYFGVEAQFWLNLQTEYDLRMLKRKIWSDIERRIIPVNALPPRPYWLSMFDPASVRGTGVGTLNEQVWIENTDRQGRERPVPGFAKLVSGSVMLNRQLSDGDLLSLGKDSNFKVLHTPGHSSGSISLLSEENGVLFCGDVIPQPGGMPIYEDVSALANSLVRLAKIENLTALYSSWADPLYGQSAVDAICAGIRYLKTIHTVVMKVNSELNNPDPMELCKRCVRMLELPLFAVNPLVVRSLLAHKDASAQNSVDFILTPFLTGGDNA